jgi:chemotaxis response regulator CheB
LVVIAASTDGIDALSRQLTTLPPSFPAPIVIA